MKLRLPRRAAALALPLLGILSASALHGCSSKPAAGIVLAMTTDVIVPEDIDAVALVFTNAETGAPIARPYVRPTAPSKAGNAVRFPSTLTLETAFDGGTFSFGTPKRRVTSVQIALVGLKGGTSPSDGEARMLRRVSVAMPESGLSLLKLNLDLLSLGGASGKLDAGQASELCVKTVTAPGLGNVQSICEDPALDYVNGACQPPLTLGDGELPSAESAEATGATCFDIPKSFGPTAAVTKVQLSEKCELKVPTGAYALAFERSNAPAVGSDADRATCVTLGGARRCLTVLEPPDGDDRFPVYKVVGDTATFAPAFCKALQNGTSIGGTTPKGLYLTTDRAKDAPVCAPWSSVQNDANPYKDFTDAGTSPVDATTPDASTPDAGTITVSGNVRFLTGGTVGLTIGGQTISRSDVGRFDVTLPAGTSWEAKVTSQPSIGGAPTGQYCSVVNGNGTGAVSVQNLEVRCVVANTFYGNAGQRVTSTLGQTAFVQVPSVQPQAFTLKEPSKVLIAYQIPTVSGVANGLGKSEEANFVVRVTRAGSVPIETAFSRRKMLDHNYGAPINGVGVINDLPAGDYTIELLWKSVGGGQIELFETNPVPLLPSLTYVALGSVPSYDTNGAFTIPGGAPQLAYALDDQASAAPEGSPFLFFGSGVAMRTTGTNGFRMTANAGKDLLVALSGANTAYDPMVGNSGDPIRSTSFLTMQASRLGTNYNVLFTNAGGQLPLIDSPSFAFGGIRLLPTAKVARQNQPLAVTAVGQAVISPITQLTVADVPNGASVLVTGTIESAKCTGNSGFAGGHMMLDLLDITGAPTVPLQRNFFMTEHAQPHTFVAVVPKTKDVPFAVRTAIQSQDAAGVCTTIGLSTLAAWSLE